MTNAAHSNDIKTQEQQRSYIYRGVTYKPSRVGKWLKYQ